MRKELGKGDIEFQFFQEFWNFYKEYHDTESSEKYWESVVYGASALMEKYEKTEICDFVNDIIQAVIKKLETDYRK